MKSSIKIDFVDNGEGKGLEPVIKVVVFQTDDPRDKLLSSFFQALGGNSNWLSVKFEDIHSDMDIGKHVSVYPIPETKLEETVAIINRHIPYNFNIHDNSHLFRIFLDEQKIEYKPNGHYTSILTPTVDIFILGQQYEDYKRKHSD